MLATRPSSIEADGEPDSTAREEKSIPGVDRDSLKEERKPLLDLDDVVQMETELAGFLDAPPPPPLSIRREQVSVAAISLPSSTHRGGATTESSYTPAEARQMSVACDFSSLYAQDREGAQTRSQMYPSIVPSAPSTEAPRTGISTGTVQTATKASPVVAQASQGVAPDQDATTSGTPAVASTGEASGTVVEDLLSENERLRIIIQEMSEELDRVSSRSRIEGSGDQRAATLLSSRTEANATRSASSSNGLAFPGAQAEAARREREQERRRQQQARRSSQAAQYVHFKCDNCPQWLRIPSHAQLVYCPVCSHTSQKTANSTIHVPSSAGQAAGDSYQNPNDETFIGFIRRTFDF